jgi:hypothetical protein
MGRIVERTGRLIGTAAGAITGFLWISAIWFPTGGLTISGVSLLPLSLLMALAALVAAIAAYHGHATVLVLVFIASFLPVGLVLLDAEHFLRFAGLLNIVLVLAAGLIGLGRKLERE